METMNFNDIVRQNSELKVGNSTFILRKLTLLDEQWLAANELSDLNSLASRLDVESLVKIAFHQIEDISELQNVYIMNNESGKEEKLKPAQAFANLFTKSEDFEQLSESLLEIDGYSRQLQRELVKKFDDANKGIEKKSLTGVKS